MAIHRYWSAGCLAALTLLLSPIVQASPLKSPKRLVGDRQVDLTPLFQWWARHDGPRPLNAWVHLTGAPIATNSLGWVIRASVENTDYDSSRDKPAKEVAPGRVVLEHPPAEDRAAFDRLKAELEKLGGERTNLVAQVAAAKAQGQAVANQQNAYRRNGLRSRALAAESRELKSEQSQANAALKSLDTRIQETRKKLAAYPNSEHYVVDCFGLKTRREYSGMPVYDHGVPMP